MKIQPAYNFLLVQLVDQRETDLVLPDSVSPILPYGLVHAVGPEVKGFAIGDKVLFQPNFAIGVSGEDRLLLVNASQIMATYVDEVVLTA